MNPLYSLYLLFSKPVIFTFLKTTLVAFLVFLLPIKGFIILITLAVGFDTIFAIYVAIKLGGIKAYQSHLLFNLVVKTFFYMFSIIFAYIIDYYVIGIAGLFGIPLLLSKITTLFWLYIEIKSWDETNQKLKNPAFIVLLKKLLNTLKDIKKDINELKKDE